MKETLVDLKNRRSCRKYLAQQIEEEKLSAILEAGTYAPTGMGRQSPVIVVVQKPELLEKISRLNAAVMGSTGDPFYGAPTLLLNAAQAVGVNSCYIFRAKEVFEGPEGKELLKQWGLPERMVGVGNCILGYAAEDGIRPPLPRKLGYIVRT